MLTSTNKQKKKFRLMLCRHRKQTDTAISARMLHFKSCWLPGQKGKRKREEGQKERGWNVQVSLLGPVEDIYLLQKQAVIQRHRRGLGQNLENNPWLGPDEHHCVVLVRSCFIVHSQCCQSVPIHTAERHVLLTAGVNTNKIEEDMLKTSLKILCNSVNKNTSILRRLN